MAFTFFFRDLHTLDHMVNQVVPAVAGRSAIRIWNAGCAMGMETYTMAILFAEKMGYFSFKNLRIDATDIDEQDQFGPIVTSGLYPKSDLERIPEKLFEKYFRSADKPDYFEISELLRSRIQFTKHNLLSLQPIGKDFSLVVCKNVLLHFTAAERGQVQRMYYNSLAPGGFLAMEQTQGLSDDLLPLFTRVVPDAQLYRKNES
jgi:chemotaxis protein methyltransferase CheR